MPDEFVIASNTMNTARVSDQVRKLLEIRDLSLRYPAREPGDSEILALSGVTLDVKQGEFVSIVGPSGCGKSTLLSAVAGLFLNYQGSISMRGQQLKGPNSEIGVVFQEDSTFPWRSVLRNVEFGLEMKGVPKEERRRKALDALNMVGLQGFVNRYPGQLSGGMKQRVAIARTLVQEPAMLLMDEPFGALDEQTRIILGDELLRIQQNLGQTVLFITHNIQEAVMLSDQVVVLSARPGTIKGIIPIDFPRPRDSTIISSTEFAEKVGQIWSILRDEALKGFNQTEKEV
jgi:NitT/TauT family transport system ATP-binding protein